MQTFEDFWSDICEYKLKSAYKYHQLKSGIKYANGCGSKGGVKFPDRMLFVLIIAACIIHDIEWKLAKNYQDLVAANERFDNNLKRITDRESMNDITRWLRRSMINWYISGVELYGTKAYANRRGFEINE